MAQVSISEAAKLTGKSRRTIQRYVATGKLSLSCNDATGKNIDISELIRVFGEINKEKVTLNDTSKIVTMSHRVTHDNDSSKLENELLKKEIEFLKQRLEDKDAHIDSLKNAMLLIESKLPTTPEPVAPAPTKKSWQFWKK
ncbi:DNA-binding protein [Proteus mirabilis]|uniref:DNA-binding protein n=1 Tax=Proteus mirabilis TaxID=584 RepID=UPI001BAF73E7|nr:DNA-binding protein [Proteus mirabilis]MBS3857569.1 DNA-binding protein [Proteus mirabilis]